MLARLPLSARNEPGLMRRQLVIRNRMPRVPFCGIENGNKRAGFAEEKVMGQAVEKLMSYVTDGAGYDVPYAEIRDVQLAALGERLRERVDKIKVVGHRAEEAGISEVRTLKDVVPLLLPHTAY